MLEHLIECFYCYHATVSTHAVSYRSVICTKQQTVPYLL